MATSNPAGRATPDRRPEATKLETATKLATPDITKLDVNSGDNVLHPVEDNPSACPGPLCPECLPDGWPDGADHCVGCAHGMWIRKWPKD